MKRMHGVIIFAVFIVFFLSTEARAPDWRYVGMDVTDSFWYYDAQSVSRGQDTTEVWIKTILSDEEAARFIDTFPATNGIENIDYTIVKTKIDCSKNVTRPMSIGF